MVSTCPFVIELDEEVRSNLMKRGTVAINWRKCTVSDYVHVVLYNATTVVSSGISQKAAQDSPVVENVEKATILENATN